MTTMRSTPLEGRTAEVARLERAAAAAAAGRSAVIALVGAYGLGKTTLLDLAQGTGVARGATVLATQGRAADAGLDFASLVTLLRPVEARLDRLAGDLAPELRAALALGRHPAIDPVAVRVATLRVLSAVAAEGPLLVLVDDAHLLDRASADVLAFAAGRFYADAVLVLIATEDYTPTAFDGLGPETIALDELDDDQIARILDAAAPLAPEPRRRCVELAEGNPLAALELAASLDAGQRTGTAPMPVIPRLHGVVGNAFTQRLSPLSDAARDALAMVAADDTGEVAVVAAALDRLASSACRGLGRRIDAGDHLGSSADGGVGAGHQLGSSADGGVCPGDGGLGVGAAPAGAGGGGVGAVDLTVGAGDCAVGAGQQLGSSPDGGVRTGDGRVGSGDGAAGAGGGGVGAGVGVSVGVGGLAEAEAAGLVTTGGGVIRFTHPLLRPAAYHQIGVAGRRLAHAALAAVLDAPHHGASRAWQQVAAAERPDAAAAAALARVAEGMDRRGESAAAARTLECAAALADDLAARRDHLVAATRAWLDAGEGRAAARVADQLAALPPTGESVAIAASALRGTRSAAQVLAFVAAAEHAVEAADRAAVAAVLADELLTAGAVADAVARATPVAPAPTGAGHLARTVLVAAGAASPFEAPLDDAPAGGGDPGPVVQRGWVLGTVAAVDGGVRRAGVWAGVEPLVAVGGTGLEMAVVRGLAALHAGEVADAYDRLQRLEALVCESGITRLGRAGLDLALAEAELLVGRAGDATGRAAAVAVHAAALGLGWLRSRAEWTLGRIALAAGDDERAVPHLREACRVLPHLAAADLVSAAVAADRPTEADTHTVLVRRFVGDRRPMLDIRARRAIGTGTSGGAHAAQRQLEHALVRAEVAGLPLEAAAVAMARAERAWRSGDVDAARAGAGDAARRWAACGVTGWAPRLARLQQRVAASTPGAALASASAPVPAAAPDVATLPAVLSPAERRVAVAVAEGRTNQEAAKTLYLSVKTIDFHLQNIYRKLGLRSRTELAVVLHHGTVPVPVAS